MLDFQQFNVQVYTSLLMRRIIPILLLILLASFFIVRQLEKVKHYNKIEKQSDPETGEYVKCGQERWDVKTLSDADTSQINFNAPKLTTVTEQIHMERPEGTMQERQHTETTEYEFDCNIIGFKREKDQDFHIVVADVNTEERMVIEIASPECESVKQSGRYTEMKVVHNWFEQNIGVPHYSFYNLPNPMAVKVRGIGYWDFLHHQTGMAANGREIHPVLSIQLK
jgi:hypothetical protein